MEKNKHCEDIFKNLNEPRCIRSSLKSFQPIDISENTKMPDDVWMDSRDVLNFAPIPYPSVFKTLKQNSDSIENVFNVMTNKGMLEQNVWKIQMALNDELITAGVIEREEKQTAKYEDLWEKLKESIKHNKEKDNEISKLTHLIATLKNNICALYKTAKDEIEQKDNLLQEANNQLDLLKKRKSCTVRVTNGSLPGYQKGESQCSTSTEKSKHYSKEKSTHYSGHKGEGNLDHSSKSNKRKRESPIKKRDYHRRSYYHWRKNTPEKYYRRSPRKNSEKVKKKNSKRDNERKVTSHSVNTKNLLSVNDLPKVKGSKERIKSDQNILDHSDTKETFLYDSSHNKSDSSTIQKPLTMCKESIKNGITVKANTFENIVEPEKGVECSSVLKQDSGDSSNNLILKSLKNNQDSNSLSDIASTIIKNPNVDEKNLKYKKNTVKFNEPESKICKTRPNHCDLNSVHCQNKLLSSEKAVSTNDILSTNSLSCNVKIKSACIDNSSLNLVHSKKAILDKDNSDSFSSNQPVTDLENVSIAATKKLSTDRDESTSVMVGQINIEKSITENTHDRMSSSFSINKKNNEISSGFNFADTHFNVFDDKTSTNAVFFGLLPDELKLSFMEYEQKHILSMNMLKQSFVNYYFTHTGATHDEYESQTCSLNQKLLDTQNNNQQKDKNTLLYFLDQNGKDSLISHQVPLIVDENPEKDHMFQIASSSKINSIPFEESGSFKETQSNNLCDDDDDGITDSTKEIHPHYRKMFDDQEPKSAENIEVQSHVNNSGAIDPMLKVQSKDNTFNNLLNINLKNFEMKYRKSLQDSYHPRFSSVFYRRSLLKKALKEKAKNCLSKSTKEDIAKLYSFKMSKTPFKFQRKTSSSNQE